MIQSFRILQIFYGYRILAALFYNTTVFSGTTFYTFSLFISSLQADFDWSRGELMIAVTIMSVVGGGTAPLIGWLVNRHGARRVMVVGAIIGGCGFALLSQVQALWQLYAGYAVLGAGQGAVGIVPSTTIVTNWFKKRRGTAIGIMSMGIGAGGLIFAPLIGGCFIPEFGWQGTYLFMAGFMWAIIPLAAFIIKTKPADLGLNPDGAPTDEATVEHKSLLVESAPVTPKMALATSAFWLVAISFMASLFSQGGVMQNQSPYLEDIGFPLAVAGASLGFVGLGSLIGKLLCGWMCDRTQAKYVWFFALMLQIAAIAILINVNSESSQAILLLYAILMGLGFGGSLPVMSMLISTYYGLASYSVIFGMLAVFQMLGGSFGPLFAAFMYDSQGTYHNAFMIFLFLYAVAIPTILVVRRPKLNLDS